MSGQENVINFDVVGDTNDSEGAVVIAGKPISSGTPTAGQVMTYSAATGQWAWKSLPISQFFSASGAANIIPSADDDIAIGTDVAVGGTDISRLSNTTFALTPGSYNIQLSIKKVTFGSAVSGQRVVLQFYNATTSLEFGRHLEIVFFGNTSTVVCSLSTSATISVESNTDISVRATIVTATTPVIDTPILNIYKLL